MTDLNSLNRMINAVNLAAAVTGNHTLAQSVGEIVLDLAQNSDMFADDLHAARRAVEQFLSRLDGRGVRRSIGRGPLGRHRITPAHEVAPFAPDAFHVNVLIRLGLR